MKNARSFGDKHKRGVEIMKCKKEHPEYVRTYTKEFKIIDGKEVCPLICDKCNIIWYEKEGK